MYPKLAMRSLYWKEFRQLTPLVTLLVLMGILLHLLYSLRPSSDATLMPFQLIYLGLPGVFAAGAGALLIGQEKELRTLDWLISLPIAPRDLIRVKLVSASVGLLVIWLFSLTLALLGGRWREYDFEWIWPINSLFILWLGVATAWYFKSSFISLLAVLPLACTPLLAVQATRATASFLQQDRFRWDPSDEPRLNIVFSLLFSVVSLWCGWRFGRRYLAPSRSRGLAKDTLAAPPTAAWLGATSPATWSPFSALVWQVTAQSRLEFSLVAILLLLLVGYPLFPSPFGIPEMLSLVGTFAAAATLGVLVFQSDSVRNRIRFLADRGVAPAYVWWSRQLVPISVLFLAVLLQILLTPIYQAFDKTALVKLIPLAAITTAFAAITYATSQWFAQLTRSAIVAAVAALLGSLLMLAYVLFALQELESPLWLLVPSLFIPFLATFLMTRRWMEGRWGLGYWLSHASWLILAVSLPVIPFLAAVTQTAGMPRALRVQLESEAERYRPFVNQLSELVLDNERSTGVVSQLTQQLEQQPGAIRSSRPIEHLLSTAELTRVQLDANATPPLRESFRSEVALLHNVVQRLRLSPRLIEQEAADDIERWLLFIVERADAEDLLGVELRATVLQSLADTANRNAARRRAIVLSWSASQQANSHSSSIDNLGGYALPKSAQGALSLKDFCLLQRSNDRRTASVWWYLNASTPAEQSRLRRELVKAWQAPPDIYTQDKLKSLAKDRPLMGYWLRLRRLPGNSWHGDWEQAARTLAGR